MPIEMNKADTVAKLREILASEPPDHRTPIYVNTLRTGDEQEGEDCGKDIGCRYATPDLSACSCVIGRLFGALGVPMEVLATLDDGSANESAQSLDARSAAELLLEYVRFTGDAKWVIASVQMYQDGNTVGSERITLDGKPADEYGFDYTAEPGAIVGHGERWDKVAAHLEELS